ncbi:hypothetical protein E2C01_040167 [Portunus trituberculatus]|uniref:Uncharacterized protein n=1 Tax=Portunus trituberculatus TaxID=210409 RepID=A0A5B7FM93_PORTR|nr:hypothetical protein [Portunus trituberculatus]
MSAPPQRQSPSPAHSIPSPPPSGSVGEAAWGHSGRPADMKAAYHRHRYGGGLQNLHATQTEITGHTNRGIKRGYTYNLYSAKTHVCLTATQRQQLENVQNRACRIILGPAYTNYGHALTTLNLPRLSNTHREALLKLGRNLLRHPKLRHLLSPATPRPVHTTLHNNVLMPTRATRTDRYKNSAIPTMHSRLPHNGASISMAKRRTRLNQPKTQPTDE